MNSDNIPIDEPLTDRATFTACDLDEAPLTIPGNAMVAVATSSVPPSIAPGLTPSLMSAIGSPSSGEKPELGFEGDGPSPEVLPPALNKASSLLPPSPASHTPTRGAIEPNIFHLLLCGERNGRRKQVIGFAIVEDDEFTRETLTKFTWHRTKAGYAATNVRVAKGKYKRLFLHHLVFTHYHGSMPPHRVLDHKDRRKHNNLPGNLQAVTRSTNAANKGLDRDNTSGFKGVSWNRKRQLWVANVCKNKRQKYLGAFSDPAEAARRVNAMYREQYPDILIPNPHAEITNQAG